MSKKDEALKRALENICAAKLCEINSMSSRHEMIRLMDAAITVLREALAEPMEWLTGCPECGMDGGCDCDSGTWNPPAQQEPVAVHQFRKRGCSDWYDGYPDHTDGGGPYEARTLYASPQSKPWVGLTDEEVNACDPQEECWNLLEVSRAIEAKLREKNA